MDLYRLLSAGYERYGSHLTSILWDNKAKQIIDADSDTISNNEKPSVNSKETCGSLCRDASRAITTDDSCNSEVTGRENPSEDLLRNLVAFQVQTTADSVLNFINTNASSNLKGNAGTINAPDAMAQINVHLIKQPSWNDEACAKLGTELTDLYDDLEEGFSPMKYLRSLVSFESSQDQNASLTEMRIGIMEAIQRRRDGIEPHKVDLLSNLMLGADKAGKHISDEEIVHVISSFIKNQRLLSNIPAWILLHLANNPEIVEELYMEQLGRFSLTSHEESNGLRIDDITQLIFHNNVIGETLRMYKSSTGDMEPVNSRLPVVGTKSSELKTWNPHRWLSSTIERDDHGVAMDSGDEKALSGIQDSFLPGPDACLGEKLAYINLLVITATLIKTFKFWNLAGIKRVPSPTFGSSMPYPRQPAIIKWERRGGGEKVR